TVDPEIQNAQARAAQAQESRLPRPAGDARAGDRVQALRARVAASQAREDELLARQRQSEQAALRGPLDPAAREAALEQAVQTAQAIGGLSDIDMSPAKLAQLDAALSSFDAAANSGALDAVAAGALLANLGVTSATADAVLGRARNPAQEAVRQRALDIIRRLEGAASGG